MSGKFKNHLVKTIHSDLYSFFTDNEGDSNPTKDFFHKAGLDKIAHFFDGFSVTFHWNYGILKLACLFVRNSFSLRVTVHLYSLQSTGYTHDIKAQHWPFH